MIFATGTPAASSKSAAHVFLFEMNTFIVFLQVRSKAESSRFAATHNESMFLTMHHRNMFPGVVVSTGRTLIVARDTHLYDFLLANTLLSEGQELS
jgi:hypothetical protein